MKLRNMRCIWTILKDTFVCIVLQHSLCFTVAEPACKVWEDGE